MPPWSAQPRHALPAGHAAPLCLAAWTRVEPGSQQGLPCRRGIASRGGMPCRLESRRQAPPPASCAPRAPPGHTPAPQVRGSACSSAKVHLWQTRVSCWEWMSGDGCITTGNSNMRNMSADEPHEGSGGHLPSTAVRDYVRHVMRDLRDYLILVVHRR